MIYLNHIPYFCCVSLTIMLQDPLEALSSWSSNTNKLMDLVMKTTHLINKEEMVHKHLASGAVTAE